MVIGISWKSTVRTAIHFLIFVAAILGSIKVNSELYHINFVHDLDNPLTSYQLGCSQWERYNTTGDSLSLQEAQAQLERSIAVAPAQGEPYFYLAKVYAEQKRPILAAQTMARAQILCPHNPRLAGEMAAYWLTNRFGYPREIYLSLVADRLCCLNHFNFASYGEHTLAIWTSLAPEISPWGTILPQRPECAMAAARYFIRNRDPERAQKLLEPISSEFLSEKYTLQGETYLLEGKPEKAIDCYRLAVRQSPADRRESYALIAAQALIKSGHLQQGQTLLRETETDSLENRLALSEQALNQGLQIEPYLQETEHYPDPKPELYYLLARYYQSGHKMSKAIRNAEKATIQAPENPKYAKYYCGLLFALDMHETAALYLQRQGHLLPAPAMLYDHLAMEYLRRNQLSQAATWEKKALAIDPENQTIRERLQKIYLRMAQGER